jgi:micrococcal nuclease
LISLTVIAQERDGPYRIHKFVDGDTLWVKMQNGKTEKIRLIGVDTPEVKWEGLTEEQPRGKEASQYVKNLLRGKKVLLEYDVQKYDPYGRTLTYVYLEDSTFLNAHLLEMGLARMSTYSPNVGMWRGFLKNREQLFKRSLYFEITLCSNT